MLTDKMSRVIKLTWLLSEIFVSFTHFVYLCLILYFRWSLETLTVSVCMNRDKQKLRISYGRVLWFFFNRKSNEMKSKTTKNSRARDEKIGVAVDNVDDDVDDSSL